MILLMKKIKIFLDCNVLIAGLASTKGASAVILRLIEADVFEIYISQQVLEEAERNLKKKLPEFLSYYFYVIKYLPITIIQDFKKKNVKLTKLFPKRSDQTIFQTAQKLQPDYFLTLNRRHFHQIPIRKIASFKIRTPAQFLDEWP